MGTRMKLAGSLWWIGTLFLLTACGGGSGGSSGESTPPPPPPPPVVTLPPLQITAGEIDTFATIAANTPEGMLQIAHYADALTFSRTFNFDTVQLCSNGGSRTITLSQPLPLQQKTVITDTMDDCYVAELDAIVQGVAQVTVMASAAVADSESLQLEVNLTKATIKESPALTVLDSVQVNIDKTALTHHIQVFPAHTQIRLESSDGELITINQFKLSTSLDFRTAKYQHQFQGRLAFSQLSRDLAFSTLQPIQGYLGEYPHQGVIEIADTQNNKVTVTANQVVNSSYASIKFNSSEPLLSAWSRLTDGNYWKIPGVTLRAEPREFRHDNFQALAQISSTDISNFPMKGTLSFLFSRPVTTLTGLENFFIGVSLSGDHRIAAVARIEGAVVHLTPVKPLSPGVSYRLGSFDAWNSLEQVVKVWPEYYLFKQFAITNDLKAVLSSNQRFYSSDTAPTLSAEQSLRKQPQDVSYQWQALHGADVSFDQPTGITTSFRVNNPMQQQRITVRLTLSDKAGNSHSAEQSFYYHDGSLSAFLFDSDQDDFIGRGESQYYSSVDRTFISQNRPANSIWLQLQAVDSIYGAEWDLEFAVPEGQILAPGRYDNLGRYMTPYTKINTMNISGRGSACNSLTGSFEIFDIELTPSKIENNVQLYQVSRLALNYVQHCDGKEPAMRGKIRFNSSYPW